MSAKKHWILLAVLIFNSVANASNLIFLKSGNPQKELPLALLQKTQTVQQMEVYETVESTKKSYKGVSMLPLLEWAFGKDELLKFDTIAFYCTDGYRSDVPLEEFSKKNAQLSFGMSDDGPFKLKAKDKPPISLGPYYLTWNHPDAESAQKEFFRWPYGVHKIDLINKVQVYKAIEPLATSSGSIKKGYEHFLRHCFSCHQLNQVGGLRGPPLNLFISIRSKEELVSYILNPQAKNKNSQMAGLPKALPEREKIAQQIIDYLKFQKQ